MPESKVYILGAGCSNDCGYPLGPEMKADLERFNQSLDQAVSPRLRKALTDTIALMGETTKTIDVLVQKLYGGQFDREIGGSHFQQRRVLSATLATCAAFLAKEPSARQTGFRVTESFFQIFFLGRKLTGFG
jgi:hypothetical protein